MNNYYPLNGLGKVYNSGGGGVGWRGDMSLSTCDMFICSLQYFWMCTERFNAENLDFDLVNVCTCI